MRLGMIIMNFPEIYFSLHCTKEEEISLVGSFEAQPFAILNF